MLHYFYIPALFSQIFSNSIAVDLKYYREYQKVPELKNRLQTKNSSNLLNNIFDGLNRKFPVESIRQNSKDFKVFIFINISQ